MKNNRILYILVAVVVVLIGGFALAKKMGLIGKPPGAEVTMATAGPATIVEKVSASGKVQPETEVKISPDVSGEITELYVQEGDSVKKGQLLLRIRPDNYLAMVSQQSAAVGTQRANVGQAQAQLEQQTANAKQTELTYRRQASLYKQKVISQSDYEAAQAAYNASQEQLKAIRAQIAAAQSTVRSAQAGLQEAQKNLNKMEVRVSVNENDIIRVQLGDSADVEVDSYTTQNERFKGIVTAIANTAKDALTAEAVTEFEVRVRLLPDSYRHLVKTGPNGHSTVPFRPGMTASVDIIADRKSGVLSVPLAAVTTRSDSAVAKSERNGVRVGGSGRGSGSAEVVDNSKPAPKAKIEEVVFVIKNGKAVLTPVKTGISDFQNIEIVSGLAAGTQVVSGPFRAVSKTLKNGTAVIVKDAASLSKDALADNGK